MTAGDICPQALSFARRNAALNKVKIDFVESDLFAQLGNHKFHLICTNPPYVMTDEARQMSAEVLKFEPHKALFAGNDGLDILRRIAAEAAAYLHENGRIICEIGAAQGEAARQLFGAHGWQDIEILHDYCGRNRFIAAQKPADE